MTPLLSFLISSVSKKKESRYICLSEAKSSLRLKNLDDLRVQGGNQDILFISLRSPGKRTPSWFSKRAPMEREARLQGILHISQKPHLSGSPVKIPPRGPLHGASLERDVPSPEPLHPALKALGRRALLQVTQTEPYEKRCPSPEHAVRYSRYFNWNRDPPSVKIPKRHRLRWCPPSDI